MIRIKLLNLDSKLLFKIIIGIILRITNIVQEIGKDRIMEKKGNKFVFLKPEDGSVSVRITITDQLMAGGEFKLFKKDNAEVLDVWKVNMDFKQDYEKIIKVPLKELNFANLVWQMLTCSQNPAVKDGAIKIEFLQSQKLCNSSINVVKRFDSIAPCKLKSPNSYADGITFVLKM